MRSPARLWLALALMALVGCTGGDELHDTSWLAVQIGSLPATPGVRSTAAFEDGQISGSGGCNSYSGTYEAELSAGLYGGGTDTISIRGIGSTEMACDEEVMSQEAAFFDALTSAKSYRLSRDRLEFVGEGGVLVAFVLT
jgi:putative lipoprotein